MATSKLPLSKVVLKYIQPKSQLVLRPLSESNCNLTSMYKLAMTLLQ